MKKLHAIGLHQSLARAMVLGVFSTLVGFTTLQGAEPSPAAGAGYALTKGTNEFGLWAGGSPDSSRIIGNTEDRKLVLFALRYGRVLTAWDSVSLEYTLDIFPAAVVFEPDRVRRGSSTIYGAGLSPLGFKFNFAQHSSIQPFVAASVGFLYFEDDIPVPHSSRFNFTPEIGLGVQFFLAPKRALTLGYKFHHMSNANTGRSNPGMDSHVFYAGFSFFTP
jgi:opacity protein-like surface antigen